MNDEQLLSISVAAKRLNVSANTLRRWTERGRIPFIRMPSGHRRFRAMDIENARRVVAEPEDMAESPVNAPRAIRSPADYLPTDRDPTPEEEAVFYTRIARSHLDTARKIIADLQHLETLEGFPEKERAKAARERKRYEKLLPTLERIAHRTEAAYARIVGRPFSHDEEGD